MVDVMIAVTPFHGHAAPMAAVAGAFVEAGHRARVYTGAARVAGLLPHAALLPHCDAMITNGGWGGILAALAADVPLVVAGGDLDKPGAAVRVTWAGAGIDVRTGRPSSRVVGRALRRLMQDPAYRANAQAVGRALRAHDGPREVVDHAMRMLRGRRDAPA